MTLIVACGLKREARIVRRVGVIPVVGGGDAKRLENDLHDTISTLGPFVSLLSAGISGALSPTLNCGDVVIDGDPPMVTILRAALPEAMVGRIVGNDAIVATTKDKQALAERTGAVAADMESHIAARVAQARGLPFGVVRVISDQLEDDLPPAALVGMRPDGGMSLGAVLASLARDPGQLPALIRTGRQAGRAFASLERAFGEAVRAI